MCLASMEPIKAPPARDAIGIAIDKALDHHHATLRDALKDVDPVGIALSCADAAALCSGDQAAMAARFLLAAEAIRVQREQIRELEARR